MAQSSFGKTLDCMHWVVVYFENCQATFLPSYGFFLHSYDTNSSETYLMPNSAYFMMNEWRDLVAPYSHGLWKSEW